MCPVSLRRRIFVIFMSCLFVRVVLLLQIGWFGSGFYLMLFHAFWGGVAS